MKYDIVIIGSGLGGLICGYILSKHGYKVVVLEKNARPGGCLQSFTRDGVIFDTGMHYVGSVEEGEIMHSFWKYLDLLKDVKLRKLDPQGYDIFRIGDQQYKYAMGYDNFVDSLSEQFPGERANIQTYIDKIKKVASESPIYNLREMHEQVLLETDHVKTSVNEFITGITQNSALRNVLAGNVPLYAGVKDKTPLYMHALINSLYIKDSYRLVGGGDTVADSLIASIRKNGGEVLNRCEVSRIICGSDAVTGVELSNGEIIEGKSFISNIHPYATMKMLDTPLIRRAYRDRIEMMENTVSSFTLYMCFKENEMPYMNSNFYSYNQGSVWGGENYTQQSWPHNYLYMHQAPLKDPNFSEGGLMIAYMNYDEVRKWEGTKVGRRGEEYEEFKRQKSERMIDMLEKDFPGIRSKIRSYFSSSPLTYQDYTNTKDGSLYGVLRDKNFPVQTLVSQRTRIPNLFLTGQNINAHGVFGVNIGSIITCAEFLGINTIIREIRDIR